MDLRADQLATNGFDGSLPGAKEVSRQSTQRSSQQDLIVKLPIMSEIERVMTPGSASPSTSRGTLLTNISTVVQVDEELNAAQRVFSTVELLEMILLRLSMTNLFVIQRVNSTVRETIHGSTRLRRRMFLESDPAWNKPNKNQINPILPKTAFEPERGLFLEFITKRVSAYRDIERLFKPASLPYFTTPSSPKSRPRDKIWWGHVQKPKYKSKLPVQRDVRESWQDMLLKQGPAAVASVRFWYRAGETLPLDYAKSHFRKQVTLGEIWDFMVMMHPSGGSEIEEEADGVDKV